MTEQAHATAPGGRLRKMNSPSLKANEKKISKANEPRCQFVTSQRCKHAILPKILYLVFQDSLIVVILALNWDWLSVEAEGKLILALVAVAALGTHIFYFLTGSIDPGYVRNQIFDNHVETTEFFEEDEVVRSASGLAVSPSKQSHAAKLRRIKATRARKPSSVLAELDKENQKERQSQGAAKWQQQESNQLFCGAYSSNDNLVMHEDDSQEQQNNSLAKNQNVTGARSVASGKKEMRQRMQHKSASARGGTGAQEQAQLQQAENPLILIDQEEQGDMRVSVYYTSGEGESSQQIDLNQIDLVESATPGRSSRRQGGGAVAQSGRVASSIDGLQSPGGYAGGANGDRVFADDEIRMCEEGPSDSLNNTEINNFFNEESREASDQNRSSQRNLHNSNSRENENKTNF